MLKARAIDHVLDASMLRTHGNSAVARPRYPAIAVCVGLVLMQMRWLYALNKIELALLIVSASMMAAAVLLLLEIGLVLSRVGWQ